MFSTYNVHGAICYYKLKIIGKIMQNTENGIFILKIRRAGWRH